MKKGTIYSIAISSVRGQLKKEAAKSKFCSYKWWQN
jgi:hypothetical protein